MPLGLRFLGTVFTLALIGVSAPSFSQSTASTSAPAPTPLLDAKHCTSCHRLGGKGMKSGSDLLYASGLEWTKSGLVASLWNHGPRMYERFEAKKIPVPKLTAEEASNLFAELADHRPFTPERPGNARAGKKAYVIKECIHCHDGNKIPPRLPAGKELPALVAHLWTDLPAMKEALSDHSWPKLTGSDIRNLIAFFGETK